MAVLGIAGGTASGKTVLARALGQALQIPVLSHDSYYRTLPDAWRGPRMAEYNFDHPDALDTDLLIEHLDALAEGRAIHLPRYDFVACARATEPGPRIEPTDWVIVEGILALAVPGLVERYSGSVFVDTPADIRLVRRIRRDCEERGDTPGGVMAQWLRTVRPMHQAFVQPSAELADLRVQGTAPLDCSISAVRVLLESLGYVPSA